MGFRLLLAILVCPGLLALQTLVKVSSGRPKLVALWGVETTNFNTFLPWTDEEQQLLDRVVKQGTVEMANNQSFVLWRTLTKENPRLADYPLKVLMEHAKGKVHVLPSLDAYAFTGNGDYLTGILFNGKEKQRTHTTDRLHSNALETLKVGYVGTTSMDGNINFYELGEPKHEESKCDTPMGFKERIGRAYIELFCPHLLLLSKLDNDPASSVTPAVSSDPSLDNDTASSVSPVSSDPKLDNDPASSVSPVSSATIDHTRDELEKEGAQNSALVPPEDQIVHIGSKKILSKPQVKTVHVHNFSFLKKGRVHSAPFKLHNHTWEFSVDPGDKSRSRGRTILLFLECLSALVEGKVDTVSWKFGHEQGI